MSFLSKLMGMRAKQAQGSSEPARPQADKTPLLRPLDAPGTLNQVPADFNRYVYADSSLATFKGQDNFTGQTIRHRAVIARMVMKTDGSDGEQAFAEIDCFVTAKDLRYAQHPDAEAIIAQLEQQTDNYVGAEPRASVAQTTAPIQPRAAVRKMSMMDA